MADIKYTMNKCHKNVCVPFWLTTQRIKEPRKFKFRENHQKNIHCVSKNEPTLASYSFGNHGLILTIYGYHF